MKFVQLERVDEWKCPTCYKFNQLGIVRDGYDVCPHCDTYVQYQTLSIWLKSDEDIREIIEAAQDALKDINAQPEPDISLVNSYSAILDNAEAEAKRRGLV